MNKIPLIFLLIFTIPSFSQTSIEKGLATINRQTIENYINILAHDSLEGREAGKSGGLQAAHFIKRTFEEIGIKPWRGNYFQPFPKKSNNNATNRHSNMQNILGCIPGNKADEIVIIGAHYDHLGINNSMEGDKIFNGADDNATGTSAVLQIAGAFKQTNQKPERTVVFALWDGEEKGLLGSFYFMQDHVSYIPIPFAESPKIKGYINLDMIGRNDNNKTDSLRHVKSTIAETKPIFEEWIRNDIKEYNLNLNPEFIYLEKGSKKMNSDYAPFWMKDIPFIYYNTGLHKDYHRVSDHADKINYDKVVDITKLAFLNLCKMANIDKF